MFIRPFHTDDLQAVYELIHAAAALDHIPSVTRDQLRVVNRPDRETVITALPSGEVAGFVWWETMRLPSASFEGWVHPHHRRKGVGTALLVAMEARLRELGAKDISGRAYTDIAGAQALFRLRGFAEARRFNQMWIEFRGQLPEPQPPPEIVLRPFVEAELAELVDADNEAFSSHWGSQPVTVEQFRRRMMIAPYYDPTLWMVAREGQRIAAICLCRPCDFGGPHDGWVWHLGVRHAYRQRGLGRLVLQYGLRRLQEAGYVRAGLHVDSENVPAVHLYESIGMGTRRQRIHFAKQLSDFSPGHK